LGSGEIDKQKKKWREEGKRGRYRRTIRVKIPKKTNGRKLAQGPSTPSQSSQIYTACLPPVPHDGRERVLLRKKEVDGPEEGILMAAQ